MKKIIIFLVIIFPFLFIFGFFFWQEIFLPKDFYFKENRIFSIEKEQSVFQIAKNLEKESLIKNKFFFNFYVIFTKNYKKLQVGEYLLSSSMNIPEIVKKISLGDVIKEKITIIEGWSLKDINWYFEKKGMFRAKEIFEVINKDFSEEFDFLKDKPKNLSLEGYLFPDTYEIKKGNSLEEIIRKILKNFDRKLSSELKEEIKKQGKTIFEIITMASLIEKEVREKEDKEIISGILWKRLEIGMPLQVDATINYLTGKKRLKIPLEDLQIDSLYNTYKYRGLPLGPISNPGLESILAALYPKDSEYWYYLSTPQGKTIFSKTLNDHNIAKAKYLY